MSNNDLLSVTEWAEKYNVDSGNTRRWLIAGRINGFKIGKQWVIPKDEQPPVDKRIKSGKYIKMKEAQL